MADLFHITRARDVESIFRQGLQKEAEPPSVKQSEEIAQEEGITGEEAMMMDSPTEQAERWFDEVVADAKRAVDAATEFPTHQPAVFFWPSRSQAEQSAKSVPWGADIVAVDSSTVPCDCAIGPTGGLDEIFKAYYDTARNHGSFDREAQFRRAKEWWREVEWYEGNSLHSHEIWCGCDIPPSAIEYIYDRSRGKRLYEPPGGQQKRLIDFSNAI